MAAMVSGAEARFAVTQGFSGKHGVDCGSCHGADPLNLGSPVRVSLEGLPAGWSYGKEHLLTIRVSGGPPANPIPGQPQAGFDLESDGGAFSEGPGMPGLLRFPNPQEATYTGAGTVRRDWAVVWRAPTLEEPPRPIRFWLAGLAANGNHLMNGPDAGGERGDRFARVQAVVNASEDARTEWLGQALVAPLIDPLPQPVAPSRSAVMITGRVPDYADGAEWSVDDADWQPAIGAPAFFFQLPALAPGVHRLAVRSVWNDRVSEPAVVDFRVLEDSATLSQDGASDAPSWPIAVLLGIATALLAPLALRLRRRK